jgi:hypothetical protein
MTIFIDTVEPALLDREQPFAVRWRLTVADEAEGEQVTVGLLTDDARLVLCDHETGDSPPTVTIAVGAGVVVEREMRLHLSMRRGLVDESSRDGTSANVALHARVCVGECGATPSRILATSDPFEVSVKGLARRPSTKFFT